MPEAAPVITTTGTVVFRSSACKGEFIGLHQKVQRMSRERLSPAVLFEVTGRSAQAGTGLFDCESDLRRGRATHVIA